MNKHLIDVRDRTPLPPEYLEYLKTTFPVWMSYFPGGTRYNKNLPLAESVQICLEQCRVLLAEADKQGLTLAGGIRTHDEEHTPLSLLGLCAYSVNLRKIRSSWKKLCAFYNVPCDNDLWRIPVTDDAVHKAEWENFRIALEEYAFKAN